MADGFIDGRSRYRLAKGLGAIESVAETVPWLRNLR